MSIRLCSHPIASTLLFTAMSTHAGEPALEDFAEAQLLITDGGFPLYQLTLPEQVYRSVAHPDLRDLRVFNAEGQIVPHLIQEPETQQHVEEQTFDLPVFPLSVNATSTNSDLRLQIEVDGSLVSYAKTDSAAGNVTPSLWVVDLSKEHKPISELRIRFRADSESFVQKLSIAQSEDLNDWRPLTEATLAHMQFSHQQLTQDRVPLPLFKGRYLRISAIDPVQGFQIEQVIGSARDKKRSRIDQSFDVHATSSPQTDQLDFDFGGNFRITTLKLNLPVPNSLFNVSLYSRPTATIDWQFRYQGTAYKLNLNGEQISDNGFTINQNDRYWQARLDANATVQGQLPTLRVTWQPDELYFVAQGSSPFTLGYGNQQLDQPKPAVHVLLNQLNSDQKNTLIGQAQPGPTRILQGSKALEVKPEIHWTRWLLWSVLAIGVLLAGRMAWRLKKEMLN